ncbi:YceI family protein [Vannielia sp.]|uniref:YceI family protein n=1 Tax=Vannielia sp. TaxID=2813045 RepID=UPI002617E502|nr:YceI family protein [Vannielia sp.]MDF1872986.1 YceI family protein [Vannielia sp.]
MKTLFLASALALTAAPVLADPETYVVDASHSQIVFSYDHMGFSRTVSMFSGFDGEIQWDKANPEDSSVTVSFPEDSLITGWDERTQHLMSGDFFGSNEATDISFVSTGIEQTGESTGLITGDLTVNGVTKEVVLDAVLNGQTDNHPMANVPWAGFSATTKLLRSDFGLGGFAPVVGDELTVEISIEAMKAE